MSHGGDGPSDPLVGGEWRLANARFEHLPVHMALLPTGKVLALGGSSNNRAYLRAPHPAEVWDPARDECRTLTQRLPGDIFCAGHAALPNGHLLVAGGTTMYPPKFLEDRIPLFGGLEHAYTFDPWSETWTRVPNMTRGRWYPTLITLADGSVLALAGLTRHFPWVVLRKAEQFRPEIGWTRARKAHRWLPLYPRLHLLPDGRVLYSGSYNTHIVFPFSLGRFPTAVLTPGVGWTRIGPPKRREREEGASVLLPLKAGDAAKVLLIGGGTTGGGVGTNTVELLDFSRTPLEWRFVAPMRHVRYYAYAVLLPDGKVLVCGGRTGSHQREEHPMAAEPTHDAGAIYDAEVFDPEAGTWTTLAAMSVPRLYHSNALLLPDGRVVMGGSNPKGYYETRIEVFSPPYLFQGARPHITASPPTIAYAGTFDIEVSGPSIDRVVLMRPGVTTHCVDTEQRHVTLNHRQTGSSFVVEVPANRNLLPPGHYMLFVLSDGIPSEAVFVRLA